MEMKRIIFVIISCLLLLGLVLVGCGGGIGTGKMVGVWPKGTDPTVAYIDKVLSRVVSGLNWTNVEYPGTEHFVIPNEYLTAWAAY
jgi:hypothetical protein